MLKKVMATSDDIALTLIRVALGVVMLAHGAQKTLGWFGGYGFSATMTFLTDGGLPWILAFLVVLAESLGALTLIVGFLGRVSAFGIAAIMLGAIFLAHLEHGFFMNWSGAQKGEGYEYHILAFAMAIVILIRGSGRFSVDRALSS